MLNAVAKLAFSLSLVSMAQGSLFCFNSRVALVMVILCSRAELIKSKAREGLSMLTVPRTDIRGAIR